MSRDATIRDIPDWFWSAEIYQLHLDLVEWANELDARIFLMQLSLNKDFNLDRTVKPSPVLNAHFVNFAIERNRGEWKPPDSPAPIRGLSHEVADDGFVTIHEQRVFAAAHSDPYPLLINLYHSKKTLLREFECFLDMAIEQFDHETFSAENIDFTTKRLCAGVDKRVFSDIGKQYRGYTSYTSKLADDWWSNCVLEYIDLFLWGLLNGLDYPETVLSSAFWHREKERGYKYDAKKDHLTVKRTVRPWACELLNRRTVARIRASSTEKK